MTDERKAIKENYTKSQLQSRGWTRAMIRNFLGQHDSTKPNPRYRMAAPMTLYAAQRVHVIEAKPEFVERKALAEKRRARLAAVRATLRQRLLDEVMAWDVDPPVSSLRSVQQAAVDDYNRSHPYHWLGRASLASDREFLDRITVNYLRHWETPYDGYLARLRGRVGVVEASKLLKWRVYRAIAVAYPELSAECERQARQRDLPPLGLDGWPEAS